MAFKPLPSGAFRHRVSLQRPTEGPQTDLGDSPRIWLTAYFRIPAEVESLGGSELYRARQVHAESNTAITFWYQGDFDTKWRIVEHAKEGDRYHYPVSVSHDGQHRQMQVLCSERPDDNVT